MDDYINSVFGPDGVLAHRFEGYVPRQGQIDLALAVDGAIRDGEHVMAEAPTGTGKSIGYSVPASYHAAHEGKRIVIATANIALQEQLVDKDLPLLSDILPWDFSFALIKGRNNYLCHDRLYQEEAQGTLELLDEPGDAGMLDPALLAVDGEGDSEVREARGMRRGDLANGGDGTRARGVDRGRDIALGFGQQLAFQHLLPDQHDGPRRGADVLLQRDVQPIRQRQPAQRRIGGGPLAVVRMHAPGRFEEAFEDAHGAIPRPTPVAAG